ncbi:uncharacterized protein LOC117822690 [Xyrichtys novacula]|uniref:Uncharacterized protein LOC117822690 n=1 Tax=Xyrichtys novacula TaxID=13765 RepID=A0AAV1FNB0_XYRNO|nr:uncharacterized protein LOC117822690 [Xyrichtys novacula]
MKHTVVFLLLPLLGICLAYTYQNVALRGKATQSHRYLHHFGDANSAIDGNRDSTFDAGSCTHTIEMANPWWRVDLLDRYVVTSVIITNRGDCCAEKLDGAEVHIGDSLQDNGAVNPPAGVISQIPAGSSHILSVNDLAGRYVTVLLPGAKRILTLCEVEVYGYRAPTENVALRGKATLSHRYPHHFGDANSAIDGNRDSTFEAGSCIHTIEMANPWWRVDLLDRYVVTSVIITNRGDCCAEKLDGAEVHIGDSLQDNRAVNPPAGVISQIPAGSSHILPVNDLAGRYVTVVLPGAMRILTLCEVEVYGYRAPTGENLALKGKATQSTLYSEGMAYFANDGNNGNDRADGSCTHTNNNFAPWWRLDLIRTHKIFTVKITNRRDPRFAPRINGAELRIGDSLENNGNNNPRCAVLENVPAGATVEYQCNGMDGRFVNVVIPGRSEYLTLCEVEVYGSVLD